MQLMIRLAALTPLVTACPAHAFAPSGRLVLHTNQGDLVRHTNQESQWLHIVVEPPPVTLSGATADPFAPFSIAPGDPWEHGNSPRMKTPPVHNIPAPGTAALLGIALMGMPARRRRSRSN